MFKNTTFTCKAEEAAVVEREGAPPQRLRLRRQQRRTTGLSDREAVAAAVDRWYRRLFLYLGLFHDPCPGPSPFPVNSASLASLCCSLSFPGKPAALVRRCFPYRQQGNRQLCHRRHPHRLVP